MKQILLKNLFLNSVLRAPTRVSHGNTSLIPLFSVPLLKIRSFSSENRRPNRSLSKFKSRDKDVLDDSVEDVSTEELKKQLQRFLDGDAEAIPDIFESVLRRKLAGNHDESDDELMKDYRQKTRDRQAAYDAFRASNRDLLDSDSDLDSDQDSDLGSDSEAEDKENFDSNSEAED